MNESCQIGWSVKVEKRRKEIHKKVERFIHLGAVSTNKKNIQVKDSGTNNGRDRCAYTRAK